MVHPFGRIERQALNFELMVMGYQNWMMIFDPIFCGHFTNTE
jgi:hypothetical protein